MSQIVEQEGVDVLDYLTKHQISNAIVFLKQAWDEPPQSIIEISWNK